MNRLFCNIVIFLSALAVVSCSEDRLLVDDGFIGEGEANIKATLSFKGFDPALASRADGTCLDFIDSFRVLIYDKDGNNLIVEKVFGNGEGETPFTTTQNNQKPADGTEEVGGLPTPKTTFDLSLPYGIYQAYIVANADFTDKEYSTVEELRKISYDWQEDNITKNNQMFGWFEDKDATTIKAWDLDADHTITINRPNMQLTAWLVRLASKVTIAYNASDLKENVFIFLKSVTIKDIPSSCTLGMSNTPEEASQLITNGESIKYYTGDTPPTEFNPETYKATLTTSTTKYGSEHKHDSDDALFFYENNQGTGKNKQQDAVNNETVDQTDGSEFNPGYGDPDDKIDFPNGNSNDLNTGYKDEKRAGTYIEVKAYYRSNNTERLGEGDITYRFMLGQNTTTDYNAKRNYHYKLTLKFNGFANDVDWHIEYVPEPNIYIPDPYYISYIYDKSLDLPVQVTGEIESGTTLKARIIDNEWMPYDYETESYPAENEGQYFLNRNPSDAEWDYTQRKWFGFLSLTDPGNETTIGDNVALAAAANYIETGWNNNSRGEREYSTEPADYVASEGDYSVKDIEQNIRLFTVPMFTRQKNLVKKTGYTGNNPYVSYQRKARVEFSVSLKRPDGEGYQTVTETITVIQVRRLINPKGIWRDWNEGGEFKVALTHFLYPYNPDPYTQDAKFTNFTSIGPWSAQVIASGGNEAGIGDDWIQLIDTVGTVRDVIYGETGSAIKFTYKPKSTLSNANQVRYGIIQVKYHNYTCEHLIYVRQGYAPISIIDGEAKWYSFNMNSKGEMASSPCEEGSLFKLFNWNDPISAENNLTYPFRTQPGELEIFGQTGKKTWSQIKVSSGQPITTEWDSPKEGMRVASLDDYLALYNGSDVQLGFGVLYDSKADEVQYPVKDAYCYYGTEPTGANKKGRGMRGCFIYNEKTGANIFLPIGAAGYGRRRGNNKYGYDGPFYNGMLVYANRNDFIPNGTARYMPLLYDIFRRPGSVYWCRELSKGKNSESSSMVDGNDGFIGMECNFITFDFYPMPPANVLEKFAPVDVNFDTNSDALRIRCVVDE